MPDAGVQPPYLDPSQYPAYLDLQRKQMLAQALMQGSQQMNQTPADWNSMRVVPKRSAFSAIAPVLTAALSGKAQKDLMGAQNNYFQGLMGGNAPPQTAGQSPSASPPSAPAQQQGSSPVAPLTAQMPPQAGLVPPTPQSNPNLLTGEPRTSQMLLSLMGPQEYGKALAGRYAPTDLAKTLMAAGVQQGTPEFQQAMAAAAKKQTTNVENVRPGGTVYDVNAGKPIFNAPQNGQQINYGADGQPTVSLLPGATGAAAAMTGAETGAKTANTPAVIPTGGGGSTYGYPGDILGAPPGLRQPGQGPQPRQAPRVGQPAPLPGQAPQASGWAGMPKLPVSNSIGAPDAFTEGRLKAAGSKDAELSSQYGQESNLADQKMQYNTDARAVLDKAEVGPSSEWLTENRSRLKEWGVPESLIPGSESVTPTLELNKVLKQSALQGARQVFGSRMTQMEVKLQHEELSPSPSMTKDAILSLMKQDDVKQQYAKQRADDYGKYISNHGDPLKFESWYSKNFPLTDFAKQHAEAGPAVAPATPTAPQVSPKGAPVAGTVQSGYRFKGGDPSKRENWEPYSDRSGVIQR